MPTLASLPAAQLFTAPFRKHRRSYVINPPDELHNVVYLGNVLTIMAKGDQSIERPLTAIWRSYSTRKRDVPMKLTVTRSGLKVETKQLGVTEYWAHRITYCYAPPEYPRVFCWVYKHEGKRMKPELRCHAVLCRKHAEPAQIVTTLTAYLHAALQEYKREKLAMEKARKNSIAGCPRRRLLLQTGTLNFRPPVNRSKSAPRLGSIDEEDEAEQTPLVDTHEVLSELEYDEISDADSLGYRETPLFDPNRSPHSMDDQMSTSSGSTQCSSGSTTLSTFFPHRQLSLSSASRRRLAPPNRQPNNYRGDADKEEQEESVVLQEDELLDGTVVGSLRIETSDELRPSSSLDNVSNGAASDQIPTSSASSSCSSSDDGFASSSHSAETPRQIAAPTTLDIDQMSDESGFEDRKFQVIAEFTASDEDEHSTVSRVRRILAANVQVTAL